MQNNPFLFFAIDTVITIGVIILISVLFIKKALTAGFTRSIQLIKKDPERFKDEFIEGSDFTKNKVVQTLQNIDQIKKIKTEKGLTPGSRTLTLFVKSLDGQDQQYHVNYILKNKQPKITEITRFM